MGLRTRVLAIVALISIAWLLLLYFVARPQLQAAFDRLERASTESDGERLTTALESEVLRLERVAADWGPRNGVYAFMRGENDSFNEVTDETLTLLGVNFMILIDVDGDVRSCRFVDLDLGAGEAVDGTILAAVLEAGDLQSPDNPRGRSSGAVSSEGRVALVASRSITTRDLYSVPAGTVVVGRYVDRALLDSLEEQTRLPLVAFPARASELPRDALSVLESSAPDPDVAVSLLDNGDMAAFVPIRDMRGAPVMVLRASVSRDLRAIGDTALWSFGLMLVIAGSLAASALGLSLEHMVLKPVSVMSEEMSQIAIHRELSSRVTVKSDDELGALATGINHALAALQESEQGLKDARDQLEERVVQRTDELHTSENRYQTLVERLADAVFICGPEQTVTFANKRAEDLCGRPLAEIVGSTCAALIAPSYRDEFVRKTGEQCATEPLTLEVKMGPPSGTATAVELRSVPLFDEAGKRMGTQWIARDITERKRFEDQLVHMANHDYLTGLFNRQFFESALDLELAESRRTRRGGAVLWLDIDDFKTINDTLGHRAGDEVLTGLATRLRAEVRESTVLSRLGGDEFAVLMPSLGADEALAVAERLLDAINTHVYSAVGHTMRVSASIGVVMYPEHGTTPSELLANADMSMYIAKASGRSCVHMHQHDETPTAEMRSHVTWNERIAHALSEDQFVVFAQPVLDLNTGTVVRHELLVRMMLDGEIVPPAEFLPAAERLGIIRDIDRWMVRQAIGLLASGALDGSELDVNLSGRAFSDAGLLADIERELASADVQPRLLGFEITETAAINDMAKAQRFISTLKDLGCRFSLDDFGSGFSSFYYLKHLPIDCLKVDGSFIRGLPDSPQDQHLVRGIVELCRGLGVEIAVEYVEDSATLDLVKQLGVDLAQGYHIGRPAPVEAPQAHAESDAS